VRRAVANKYPDHIKKLSKTKRNPAVSLTSLYMMHLERLEVDAMLKAAGDLVISVEHDGIVLRGAGPEQLAAVRAATKWPTHVSTYP
jgi:hypothetical protein